MTRTLETPGQKLWLSLIEADQYDEQAEAIVLPPGSDRMTPELATRNWSRGMAKNLRARFPGKLRQARQAAGLTQKQLSELADLSANGLAMIERGERVPNLETAARICWALDVAHGDF
jgi:DNA-binding XRE family transcriptional regulator